MSGSASKISVTISATDLASKQIEAVNAQIAKMQPASERTAKGLGKLTDATRVRSLAGGMRDVARESFSAFENISRMVPALGAITGVASVAGLARMSEEFARYSQSLDNTSKRAKISAVNLRDLENASQMKGVASGAMTAGLTGLQDTIAKVGAGLDPEAANGFKRLGIDVHKANGQLKTASEMMPEMATALAKFNGNPTEQAYFANLFGPLEPLLPILRLGAKAMEELNRRAHDLGGLTKDQIDRGIALNESFVDLRIATDGLTGSIAAGLEPALKPLLDSTGQWIKDNRELVANDVAGWAKDYGNVLGFVGSGIDTVVTSTVGWNKAMEVGIPLLGSRMIPQLAKLENALVRIAGIEIPTWLAKLMGISVGAFDSALATILGGGYLSGKSQAPMVDDYGNVVGNWGGKKDESQNPAAAPGIRSKSTAGIPTSVIRAPGPLPIDIEAEVIRQARANGLDADHMIRLARAEHGGYNNVSSAGAIGPMQLMPGTARDMGVDPSDWRQNVDGGMRYYHQLLERFHGNYAAADAAYNAGPNNPGVAQFAASGDPSSLPAETQKYIAGINVSPGGNPAPVIQGGSGAAPSTGDATPSKGAVGVTVTLNNLPADARTSTATSGDAIDGSPKVVRAMPLGMQP